MADEHVQILRDLKGVGKGESHEPWLQRLPAQDGEQGGEEDDEIAEHFEADREPAVGNDAGLEAGLIQVHLLLQLLRKPER